MTNHKKIWQNLKLFQTHETLSSFWNNFQLNYLPKSYLTQWVDSMAAEAAKQVAAESPEQPEEARELKFEKIML